MSAPTRANCLACSNTEIVAALGLAHTLVGVDDHSDFPAEAVAPLPRLGPDLSIDVAKVAALRPDLVLASLTLPGHERVVDALRAAGLPVALAPDPQRLDDVYRDIRDIGALLGAARRAEALVADMQDRLRPRPPAGVRILVEWWPKPVIVPGRRSWVTDVIALAGGINPFGDRDVRSTPITDAEAADAAPDVVVVSWCGVPLRRYRPEVAELSRVFRLMQRTQRASYLLARQGLAMTEEVGPMPEVGEALIEVSTALNSLAGAVGHWNRPVRARELLLAGQRTRPGRNACRRPASSLPIRPSADP